jgi:flagellin
MRIATNMSALTACDQLRKNDNTLAKSLERLSSGYKINNAGDDPVGAAISKKMKTQIRGLERANQNASDGISVVETAEGALNEITAMVQRIRELSVQGATDTYTDDDRVSLNNEIDQLKIEIDRIANDTEFNSKSLLNGDLSRNTYTNRADVSVTYVSSQVESGVYYLAATPATKSVLTTTGAPDTITVSGTIKINDASVTVNAGDSFSDVYERIMKAADKVDASVETTTGNKLTITSNYPGDTYPVEIEASSEELAKELGFDGAAYNPGVDAVIERDEDNIGGSGFSNSTIITADGNDVTIKASGGFEMHVHLDDSITGKGLRVQCYVLDSGTMTIQLGANEGQEMEIELPEITCKSLGIDKLNTYTSKAASRGISACDDAISYINQARSRIGAYENRLESAISSLGVTNENLTSALSRIEDVDMAYEMTQYTTMNVLSQAATSMLSQANQLPEKVLQLLE